MIVLDASATVDLLLRRGACRQVEELITAHDVHAPDLLTVEVLQVLRRFVLRGELSDQRATESVNDLLDLAIEFYPLSPTARALWRLRSDISAYDACYVTLAAGLDAPLVTTDQRLVRTARRYCAVSRL